MALTQSDILRFTVFQTFLGQQVLNVDFRRFELTGASQASYEDVLDGYRLNWNALLQPQFFSDAWTFDTLLVENMTNGLDEASQAVAVQGTNLNEAVPSFVAARVQQFRATKLTRHGFKRLSGLVEAQIDGNTLPYGVTTQDNIATMFGTPMSITADGTLNGADLVPVIVGRTLNPGTGVYEIDLNRVNDVLSAAVTGVTTQNSRKLGHGG